MRVRAVSAPGIVSLLISAVATAGVGRWTSRGPEGASILSLALDPTRPDILYAGNGTVGVGGHGRGVLKSVDDGQTWAPSGIGLTTDFVAQILIDPVNPDRLYARAQATDGTVFVSTDGGAQWEPLSVGTPVFCMASGGAEGRTVLYAGTGGSGVLKSTDSGVTWNASGLVGFSFFAVFVDPSDSDTAYASPGPFGGDSFRTNDGGTTWQTLHQSTLAMDPSHPRTLYAIGSGTVLKSTDSGNTWSPTGAQFGDDPIFMAVDPSDSNRLYVSTLESFWTSSDGGATWVHADNPFFYDSVTSLAFDPRDPAVLYAGRRLTGPYRSTDRGRSFLPIHHGLTLTDINAFQAGSTRGGPLYIDASSCTLDRSEDGGRTWCCVDSSLNGNVVAVDPLDPLTVYASIRVGDSLVLHRSRDGGLTWTPIDDPDASLQLVIVFDPKDPSVIYAFYPGLFRSGDGGQTWAPISAGLPYPPTSPANQVTSVAVDPQSPSIFAATYHCVYGRYGCTEEASALSRSMDAGQSWTTIPQPPGAAPPMRVSVPPANPGAIYVLSDYGGAFRSRDSGGSWTVVRATLDQLTFDPLSPSTLYGVEGGLVLRSTDNGSTWFPFGEGLDGVSVASLFVDSTGNVLRAATSGGGLQEYDYGSASTNLSTAPGEDFLVSLAARDQRTGRTSAGLAVQPADDFAWFSLPDLTGNADNPEVFVKVVDGRPINGRFWVFYGGLTDVEYTISVTQESNSLLRTYSKAAGSACGAFDTKAFPPDNSPAASAATGSACAAEGDLFLEPGRSFIVSLTASDPRTGRTTSGVAANENDSFGTFSLPAFTDNLSNPEVFVKILDGRLINGHFWIFYGGLTDVEFTMTVTDAVTGLAHAYEKPAGSTCGGFDTTTFSE